MYRSDWNIDMATAALKNKTRNTKGIATIEMALLLPILCMLTFGVMEYGWMFLKAQSWRSSGSNRRRHCRTGELVNHHFDE